MKIIKMERVEIFCETEGDQTLIPANSCLGRSRITDSKRIAHSDHGVASVPLNEFELSLGQFSRQPSRRLDAQNAPPRSTLCNFGHGFRGTTFFPPCVCHGIGNSLRSTPAGGSGILVRRYLGL